ncbi:HypC/HybG/HupF family hydrogenase formation chaperone [Elusimicrobiota bacterium]
MCLAIPGKIISKKGPLARVDFNGITKNTRLDLLPKAKTGDYVIVHVGYAIQALDQKEAKKTMKDLRKYGIIKI